MERTILIPVPEDEFFERLAEAVFRRFKMEGFGTKPESKKWLSHQEAAAYIRKTPAALYKISSLHKIKFTKRGKSNSYRVEDLDRYMQEGLVPTADEIKTESQLQPKNNYPLIKKLKP